MSHPVPPLQHPATRTEPRRWLWLAVEGGILAAMLFVVAAAVVLGL